MKSVLVLVVVVAAVSADSYSDLIKEEWNVFKKQHGKNYENESEEAKRMKVYLENRQNFAKHNQRFAEGLESYQLGLNEFSDMHHDEFLKVMNVKDSIDQTLSDGSKKTRTSQFIKPANMVLAETTGINWVQRGAVTSVQNQKNCNCGWAFSAVGAIEGQQFRASEKLEPLSVQNLIDCSKEFGNKGCAGGDPVNAFTYVMENDGIDTKRSYPYEAKDDKKCRFDPMKVGASVSGIVQIPTGDETMLETAVTTVGPISAMIDASLTSFKNYMQGVYNDPQCSATKPTHGVLIVGYGTDSLSKTDYWIVKNSWGVSWGDFGYMKLLRGKNMCGIASAASYPLV